jgi:hypothetical protein
MPGTGKLQCLISSTFNIKMVSRVAQSVYRLAMDWTTGRFSFDPRQR